MPVLSFLVLVEVGLPLLWLVVVLELQIQLGRANVFARVGVPVLVKPLDGHDPRRKHDGVATVEPGDLLEDLEELSYHVVTYLCKFALVDLEPGYVGYFALVRALNVFDPKGRLHYELAETGNAKHLQVLLVVVVLTKPVKLLEPFNIAFGIEFHEVLTFVVIL